MSDSAAQRRDLIGSLLIDGDPSFVLGEVEWAALEGDIGTRLPSDGRWFSGIYGVGSVAGEMDILSPSSVPRFSLRRALDEARIRMAMHHESGDLVGEAVFPEPGGLLPWAESGNGDVWYWDTGDDPERWTVAFEEAGVIEPELRRYPMTMVEYLLGLIGGGVEDDVTVGWGARSRYIPFSR